MFFWKKFCIILAILLCMPVSMSVNALSDTEITAPSAVLMDSQTGQILYEKNAHEVRPCASITKVMTLTLVMEALDSGKISLSDTVTTSAHASSMGGSDIWLEVGEIMTVDEMVKATIVASANDAAVALAEHICGTEDEFVAQMNKKAKSLGMKETVFKNCNGLDEDGHVTSAYDVAVMSRELIKHKKIFDYSKIWMDNLRGGKTQLVNTNKLLKTYRGITGLKTGTTDDAGCCISATAEREGMGLIGVVLGADTGKQRFADAAALLDYGFANYAVKELKLPDNLPSSLKVSGGMTDGVGVSCEVSEGIVMNKASMDEVQVDIDLPDELEAPVEKNQKVGSVNFTAGKEKRSFDVTADGSVKKTSFGLIFGYLINSLLAL